MATMAPISVCNTRPSIGATVDISTATLWRLEGDRAAPAHSFAVIVRKTALGNSLRRAGPGGG